MRHNELPAPEGAHRDRKRVGRGYGSGHGKTSGRGQKGQNSRTGGGVRVGFEGGQSPLILRMPYKRGFTNFFKTEWQILNVGDLALLDASTEITPESLLASGLVAHKKASTQDFRVKLLGNGEVSAPLNVRVHRASAGARAKIEAAGGSLVEIEPAEVDGVETGDSADEVLT